MIKLTSLLATISSWLNLAVATVLCGVTAVLTAWLPPRGASVSACGRLWSRWWLAASGVRLFVGNAGEAPRRVPPAAVYLANHASWYDIPALILAVPGRVRFMAKRSLFRIPIFGWALAAGGFVPVDRKDRSRAKESFQAALDGLAAGGSLILFPEGTRSRDGRVHAFQRGGFLLALKAGLPVVPVGIAGTDRVLPRTTLMVRPGPVTVRFGEPLDPAAFGLRGRRELMRKVRAEVAALSGRPLASDAAVDAPEDVG